MISIGSNRFIIAGMPWGNNRTTASIDPALVEKDYWIMQGLYGLQKLGMKIELKGGTSLSKGLQIIHRFSEDIDIGLSHLPNLMSKLAATKTARHKLQRAKDSMTGLRRISISTAS